MPNHFTNKFLEIGKKYGKLTVLEYSHKDHRYRKYYKFLCDCGNEKIIYGSTVISGNTSSCGCKIKEAALKKRISNNHTEKTAILLGYKSHAKKRNLDWNITREYFEEIITKNCYYCGSEPQNLKKTKNSLRNGLLYSGIDRKNNNLGYTKENVVPCCRICNRAKSNLTIEEFKEWILRIKSFEK